MVIDHGIGLLRPIPLSTKPSCVPVPGLHVVFGEPRARQVIRIRDTLLPLTPSPYRIGPPDSAETSACVPRMLNTGGP